jgi:hypothetical protein
MLYGRELEIRVNHAWKTYFEPYAKHAVVRMAKNSRSGPVDFRLPDIAIQKFWMLAWKKNAFDSILGFNTQGLQNEDQDLYREITSYTWSEMNDGTRDSLETTHGFIGKEHVPAEDGGKPVPVTRADLALRNLAASIERKPLELVSKAQFKSYFQSNRFRSKRSEWSKRVEDLRKVPEVVVGVPQPPAQSVVDTAHLARVAASAATSAVAQQSSSNVSVAVAVASSTPVPAPPPSPVPQPPVAESPPPPPAPPVAPPPPPTPMDITEDQARIVAERQTYTNPSAAEGSDTDDFTPLDVSVLEREFTATREWAFWHVGPNALEATRTTIAGFRFYAKFRATANAKTAGQRDLYCAVQKDSRAERLCLKAGLSIKKTSDRLLRSKKDIQRFCQKIVDSGIDLGSVN